MARTYRRRTRRAPAPAGPARIIGQHFPSPAAALDHVRNSTLGPGALSSEARCMDGPGKDPDWCGGTRSLAEAIERAEHGIDVHVSTFAIADASVDT